MAHKDWCGKTVCGMCEKQCELDLKIPCSPSCDLLGEDGQPISVEKCIEANCDTVDYFT